MLRYDNLEAEKETGVASLCWEEEEEVVKEEEWSLEVGIRQNCVTVGRWRQRGRFTLDVEEDEGVVNYLGGRRTMGLFVKYSVNVLSV